MIQNLINTIIAVENGSSFYLQEKWKVADDTDYVRLENTTALKDGNPNTEALLRLVTFKAKQEGLE